VPSFFLSFPKFQKSKNATKKETTKEEEVMEIKMDRRGMGSWKKKP
jgi:hypothetical protein